MGDGSAGGGVLVSHSDEDDSVILPRGDGEHTVTGFILDL